MTHQVTFTGCQNARAVPTSTIMILELAYRRILCVSLRNEYVIAAHKPRSTSNRSTYYSRAMSVCHIYRAQRKVECSRRMQNDWHILVSLTVPKEEILWMHWLKLHASESLLSDAMVCDHSSWVRYSFNLFSFFEHPTVTVTRITSMSPASPSGKHEHVSGRRRTRNYCRQRTPLKVLTKARVSVSYCTSVCARAAIPYGDVKARVWPHFALTASIQYSSISRVGSGYANVRRTYIRQLLFDNQTTELNKYLVRYLEYLVEAVGNTDTTRVAECTIEVTLSQYQDWNT
jgi:hypothetical protein